MKVIWLGQAGLLFETNGRKIFVDPYLSDSAAGVPPYAHRRVPADEKFLRIQPDVVICTHNHADHADKETLKHYFTQTSEVLLLAPYSAWKEIRLFGGNGNNYVLFNAGTEWTFEGIRFRAVYAEHSDPFAVGVIISAEGKNYYVTGDTLYNEKIFADLAGESVYAVFLPVNGKGNNMNCRDAARFAERIKAEAVVPMHIGLFDDLTADIFECPNKIRADIFREIPLKR